MLESLNKLDACIRNTYINTTCPETSNTTSVQWTVRNTRVLVPNKYLKEAIKIVENCMKIDVISFNLHAIQPFLAINHSPQNNDSTYYDESPTSLHQNIPGILEMVSRTELN